MMPPCADPFQRFRAIPRHAEPWRAAIRKRFALAESAPPGGLPRLTCAGLAMPSVVAMAAARAAMPSDVGASTHASSH